MADSNLAAAIGAMLKDTNFFLLIEDYGVGEPLPINLHEKEDLRSKIFIQNEFIFVKSLKIKDKSY